MKSKGVDKDADVLADRGFGIAYGLSQYKRTNDYSWLRVAQNNIDTYNRIIGRLNCAQWTLACDDSASVPALNSSAEIRAATAVHR